MTNSWSYVGGLCSDADSPSPVNPPPEQLCGQTDRSFAPNINPKCYLKHFGQKIVEIPKNFQAKPEKQFRLHATKYSQHHCHTHHWQYRGAGGIFGIEKSQKEQHLIRADPPRRFRFSKKTTQVTLQNHTSHYAVRSQPARQPQSKKKKSTPHRRAGGKKKAFRKCDCTPKPPP